MAIMLYTSKLLANYPIISDQIKKPSLEVVLSHCEQVLRSSVDGAVVEFGCYIGTTSLFLRRLLDVYAQPTATDSQQSVPELHVYDSFSGLPPKTAADTTTVGDAFQAGELQVSKKQLLQEFRRAHLDPPIVHKGWFNELQPSDIPDSIAFAFLDGDFYESIIDSLRWVWPRLSEHGIICIDDYQREQLPGVERAVRDFFQGKAVRVTQAYNIGIVVRATE